MQQNSVKIYVSFVHVEEHFLLNKTDISFRTAQQNFMKFYDSNSI